MEVLKCRHCKRIICLPLMRKKKKKTFTRTFRVVVGSRQLVDSLVMLGPGQKREARRVFSAHPVGAHVVSKMKIIEIEKIITSKL